MGQRRARIRCMEVLLLEEGVEGGKFPAAQADSTQVRRRQEPRRNQTKVRGSSCPSPQEPATEGLFLGVATKCKNLYLE